MYAVTDAAAASVATATTLWSTLNIVDMFHSRNVGYEEHRNSENIYYDAIIHAVTDETWPTFLLKQETENNKHV